MFNDQDYIIVSLSGNVTKKPTLEIRPTKDGPMPVCDFYVGSTERSYTGEEHTLYFQVAIWGADAENAAMLEKGQKVVVTGHMRKDYLWKHKVTGEPGVTHKISADWGDIKVGEVPATTKPRMEVLDLRDQVTA